MMKNKTGFSLVELLVAVSIVGILAALSVANFAAYKEKAEDSQVQVELSFIRNAIVLLEMDTEETVGGIPLEPCVQNPEANLTSTGAGLLSNDGRFDNWNGPYIDMPLTDPWGNAYWFDPDYNCQPTITGCPNTGSVWLRAAISRGRDGSWYTADDVAVVLCTS